MAVPFWDVEGIFLNLHNECFHNMKLNLLYLVTAMFLLGSMVSYSQGDRCSSIQPFCAGDSQLIFPNSNPQSGGSPDAETGPYYGCLNSQPFPAWYYLQVGTSGDLRFTISQSENQDGTGLEIDVDFIVWGPFDQDDDYCSITSLTAQNTVDCSYADLATEVMTIPNAQAGKIYIVMITNYDEVPGYISLQQTNTGGGSTDCSIVGNTLGPDQRLCGAQEYVLDAENAQASQYIWFVLNEVTGEYEIIEGETGPTLTVAESGNYQVTVISDFFESEESDQVVIEFFDVPVANTPSTVIGCSLGDVISFDLTSASGELIGANPGKYFLRFYLSQEDFESGENIPNPSNYGGSAGSLLATITNEVSGCESLPVTVELEVAEAPKIGWNNLTPVCTDAFGNFLSPVSLGDDLGAEYIYYWDPVNDPDGDGVQNPINTFTNYPPQGIVTLEIINTLTGCVNNYATEIQRFSPPLDLEVVITGNDFEANGYTAVATVIDENEIPATYEYRLNEGPWQPDPVFRRVPGGTHRITAREVNGCGIVTSRPFSLVGYPRFFTPNGDGYNDTWNVINDASMSITRVIIFDRYGKLIKQLNPSSGGWDGTFNGRELPADDYWFLVYYSGPGNISEEYKGNFTLKR